MSLLPELTIPLARYRFHFTTRTPLHFPEWAGSTLRGAFGHALRQLACMTRQKDCAGCPLQATCPYPAIFAPAPRDLPQQQVQQPPAPYVIEPAAWGAQHLPPNSPWHVDMVLMGRAAQELPIITLAWQRAAARGLGTSDGQSDLVCVEIQTPEGDFSPVLDHPQGRIVPHELAPLPSPEFSAEPVKLEFITPLRLQENGKAIPPARLTAERLLMHLVRRVSLLATCHGRGQPDWNYGELKRLAAAVNGQNDLKWQDWTRRSSRQQQTMQLGGAIGHWTLHDLPPVFYPLLHWGQWLHIGKETVFGLGRYTLQTDNSQHPRKSPERPVQVLENMVQSQTPQIQNSPDF